MVNSRIILSGCAGPLLLGCAASGILPTHCAHDGVMVGDHLRVGDENYTVPGVFGYSPRLCAGQLSTLQTHSSRRRFVVRLYSGVRPQPTHHALA